MNAQSGASKTSDARLREDKETHDAKMKKHELTDNAAQSRQDTDKSTTIAQPKYLPKPETPFDVEVDTTPIPPRHMTSDSEQLQDSTKVRYRLRDLQQQR